MSEHNGTPAADGHAERWPRFGDLPTQTLHPDLADAILQLLWEREPSTFARLHMEALAGAKFTVTVRRRDPARDGGKS